LGTPSEPISALAGFRAVVTPETMVRFASGCDIIGGSTEGFAAAAEAARQSQVAVMVMGLSQHLDGEEGQQEGNPPGISSRGDRGDSLDLPPIQQELLRMVYETGTPVILVLMNGSMISINWADEHVPAILEAWYPGQAGGATIANALFGLYNPGGRLPVTFYRSVSDLPPFEDYNMNNRTYRYFTGDPLYAFGYGLSYTTFSYSNLQLSSMAISAGETLSIQADVENTGGLLGDEVVQLYVQDVEASSPIPQIQLQGFARIRLVAGEKQTVQFTLKPEQLSFVDDNGQWTLEPGAYRIWIGGQQPKLKADEQPENVLEGEFVISA
jgi:beta-glucosidase